MKFTRLAAARAWTSSHGPRCRTSRYPYENTFEQQTVRWCGSAGILSQSQDILAQFHQVGIRRRRLSQSDVEDECIIKYWTSATSLYDGFPCPSSSFTRRVSGFTFQSCGIGEVFELGNSARDLADVFSEAEKKDVLSWEHNAAIRERWTIVDPFFDDALPAGKGNQSRPYPACYVSIPLCLAGSFLGLRTTEAISCEEHGGSSLRQEKGPFPPPTLG